MNRAHRALPPCGQCTSAGAYIQSASVAAVAISEHLSCCSHCLLALAVYLYCRFFVYPHMSTEGRSEGHCKMQACRKGRSGTRYRQSGPLRPQIALRVLKVDKTHPEARKTLVDDHSLLSTLDKLYECVLKAERCGAGTSCQDCSESAWVRIKAAEI